MCPANIFLARVAPYLIRSDASMYMKKGLAKMLRLTILMSLHLKESVKYRRHLHSFDHKWVKFIFLKF